MQGEQAIIEGIESDAATQASRLLSDAQAYAQQKLQAAQNQVNSILVKARTDAKDAIEALQRTERSALAVEKRRQILALREKTCDYIFARIMENLETLPQKSDIYRALLLEWTTEALAGLDADEAVIAVSRIDLPFFDTALLKAATQRAGELTGRNIIAEINPKCESKQGVFARTKDGRMGFNNQIQTRLRRMEDQIRDIIQKSLFDEGES